MVAAVEQCNGFAPAIAKGSQLTDARMPERWLLDRRVSRLTDAGFRAFATSLMWSVAARTDGVILLDDFEFIPKCSEKNVPELLKSGLWITHGVGWLIVDYEVTQTSASQLASAENKRRIDRERQSRHRSKSTGDRDKDRDVTRDTTGDDKGQGLGQGHAGEAGRDNSDSLTWETARVPRGEVA